MKTKFVILTVVLLAVSLSSVYAGNSLRTGTDGALELLIPIGSRGTSMGGAVVANTYGVESIVWNPAGLAELEGTEAMFTYMPYIADIDVNFAGVATRMEDFGTLAASVKVVNIGDMEETTQEYPNGTGRTFSPTMTVIGLSYARILTANVSFGVNAMFIHEDVFNVQASGVAFDVGFLYNPRWRGLQLGFTVKNYGPEMSYSGDGFKQPLDDRLGAAESAPFDLPSSINMGVAYDVYSEGPNQATVSGNFRSNNYSEDYYQAGAEYVYDGKYSFRAGYNFSDDDYYLYGASLGAGLKLNVGGTDLTFEYSWTETDVFDDNQYFTVKANF